MTASRAKEPPMLRRTAALGLFTAAVAALTGDPAPVRAQDKPLEEAFFTADGVKLRGLFHTSPKGSTQNDSAVVLLYPPGGNNTLDSNPGWDSLTKALIDNGFHVFRFDWRGHGKSTVIDDPELFWNTKNG